MGIVNGTTNYILTKMSQEGAAYADVLKEAQELGYAESDPTSDVEGLDAARKMTILSTLGFRANVSLEDVSAKGISCGHPRRYPIRQAARLRSEAARHRRTPGRFHQR